MMSCPRCGGLVYRMHDDAGKGLQCFVCAWIRWDMPPAAYEDHPARDGEPDTAKRYMERRRASQRKRYARRKAEA